jgi:hypothetical protein
MQNLRTSLGFSVLTVTLMFGCAANPHQPSTSVTTGPFERTSFWSWVEKVRDDSKSTPSSACLCVCQPIPQPCVPRDPFCERNGLPETYCVDSPAECQCGLGETRDCVPEPSCAIHDSPFHQSGLAIHLDGSSNSNCVGLEFQYAVGWSDSIELRMHSAPRRNCEISFAFVVVPHQLSRRFYMPRVSLDWHAKAGDAAQCGNAGTQVIPAYESNGFGQVDLAKLTYSIPAMLNDDTRPGGCELVIRLINEFVERPSPYPLPSPTPAPIPNPYYGPSLQVVFESLSGTACDGTTAASGRTIHHGESLAIGTHFSDPTEACKLSLRYSD